MLCFENRKCIEAKRIKAYCVVLCFQVPDRGGRPSNVAPPIEMPAFTKRTEAPRDQRPSSK